MNAKGSRKNRAKKLFDNDFVTEDQPSAKKVKTSKKSTTFIESDNESEEDMPENVESVSNSESLDSSQLKNILTGK